MVEDSVSGGTPAGSTTDIINYYVPLTMENYANFAKAEIIDKREPSIQLESSEGYTNKISSPCSKPKLLDKSQKKR